MIIIYALITLRKVKNTYLMKVKCMQRSGSEAIRTQLQPSNKNTEAIQSNWQNGRPVRSKPTSFIPWHCTIFIRNAEGEGHSGIKAAKPKNTEEKETPNAASPLSSYKYCL